MTAGPVGPDGPGAVPGPDGLVGMPATDAPDGPDAPPPRSTDLAELVAPDVLEESEVRVDPEPVSLPATVDESADCAEDLAGVLRALVADLRFAELGDVLRVVDALRGPDRRRVLGLCHAGARLLALDAEAFASVEGVPEDLQQTVAALHFPRSAADPERGSLESLDGLYGLMQEALAVHFRRGDAAFVVLICHLIAEYLPLLAWQDVLGHAGDPVRLRGQVLGSRWGTTDGCPHAPHLRRAATRVLDLDVASSGAREHPEQWQAYLDKWHARVSAALRQCGRRTRPGRPGSDAAGCATPCGVVDPYPPEVMEDLADRLTLAAAYAESPLVALRHSAPVGHYFGVPTVDEVSAAWKETATRLTRRWGAMDVEPGECDARNPLESRQLPALPDGEEPLPGLSSLIGVVAGHSVPPSTVLHRVAAEVSAVLEPLLSP